MRGRYNTRAWLLFEAGRRADFDLTALSADGDYVGGAQPAHAAQDDPTAHAWRRAVAHAGAAYYAVTTVPRLLAKAADGRWSLAASPRLEWVPRERARARSRSGGSGGFWF